MSREEILADPSVERALLSACLLSDSAIEAARDTITPWDFSNENNRNIFRAILDTHASGVRVDAVSVAANYDGDGKLLHEIQNDTGSISNAAFYARQIAGWRLRRDLTHAGAKIIELARIGTSADEAGEAVDQSRALIDGLDLPSGVGAPDPDVDSFIRSVDTEYDWLVPDFLERRDRMLVTASEGGGKSTLLTQIGFMVACGIHPWTHQECTPRNVTIIDLENSNRLVSRRLESLRKIAGDRLDPQRLRVHVRPDGLNLTGRTDRNWLLDRCRANATELLVIGPAYRMSSGVAERGDVGGEDQARTVTRALDDIRVRCNVALLMETHAPHGSSGFGRDLRPFGSSVWLRWPEFGIGLRREDPEDDREWLVEHWRGPRDIRTWPRHLMRRSGRWPWTPSGMPNGTFNNRSSA